MKKLLVLGGVLAATTVAPALPATAAPAPCQSGSLHYAPAYDHAEHVTPVSFDYKGRTVSGSLRWHFTAGDVFKVDTPYPSFPSTPLTLRKASTGQTDLGYAKYTLRYAGDGNVFGIAATGHRQAGGAAYVRVSERACGPDVTLGTP